MAASIAARVFIGVSLCFAPPYHERGRARPALWIRRWTLKWRIATHSTHSLISAGAADYAGVPPTRPSEAVSRQPAYGHCPRSPMLGPPAESAVLHRRARRGRSDYKGRSAQAISTRIRYSHPRARRFSASWRFLRRGRRAFARRWHASPRVSAPDLGEASRAQPRFPKGSAPAVVRSSRTTSAECRSVRSGVGCRDRGSLGPARVLRKSGLRIPKVRSFERVGRSTG